MDNALQLNEIILTAAIVFVLLALICNLVVVTSRRSRRTTAVPAAVHVGADRFEIPAIVEPPAPGMGRRDGPTGLALYATGFTVVGFVLTTVYLGIRMWLTGYGPFANQHEFAVSFVWGILLAYLIAEWRFRIRALALVVLPIVAALMLYAMAQDTSVQPLIPALQNNLLLTLHVGFAILAYGAAAVSCGAAVLYLVHPRLAGRFRQFPEQDVFDDLGYKAAAVTFPLLTIMIALGALWADTAWGRFWGWDPKETAALVTWLIYGAYLHARVTRGWQGSRSAWLLLLGFAAVLFAYFGNHFFGGLHSYG
ncbi:MAG: c-type cytochrome biogenesis protein CcsB [Ruaniaceae bacterium]|nr:c-type cytochrome biogenesis protein CcsB [Ruaniaceae bacterium]